MKNIAFSPITDDKLFNNKKKGHKRSLKNGVKNEKGHKKSIKNKPKLDNITEKDENNIKKKKCFVPTSIKISIIIIFILALICSIILILLKKFKKNNKENSHGIPTNPLEIPINRDITRLKYSFDNIPIIITTSKLNYKEAESLINSSIIVENHNLLTESIKYLNNILEICDSGMELNPKISEISYNLPNFLINPTKGSLKIVKSDIELYKGKYEELSAKISNLSKAANESIKNFYLPLNNTKTEIIKILNQFEETIKNLSIPFFLYHIGLNDTKINEEEKNEVNKRRLSINNEIEEYRNENNNLNELYNKLFKYINEEVQIMGNEILRIPNTINGIQKEIEEEKQQYSKILEEFINPEDYLNHHNNLIEMKNTLISVKEDSNNEVIGLERTINSFGEEYRNRKIDSEDIIKSGEDILERMNSTSISIKNGIDEIIMNNLFSFILCKRLLQ